jgi:hypothetical protein
MQQPWAHIFLGVNGDGDDALGLSVPELPVTPTSRSERPAPSGERTRRSRLESISWSEGGGSDFVSRVVGHFYEADAMKSKAIRLNAVGASMEQT